MLFFRQIFVYDFGGVRLRLDIDRTSQAVVNEIVNYLYDRQGEMHLNDSRWTQHRFWVNKPITTPLSQKEIRDRLDVYFDSTLDPYFESWTPCVGDEIRLMVGIKPTVIKGQSLFDGVSVLMLLEDNRIVKIESTKL